MRKHSLWLFLACIAVLSQAPSRTLSADAKGDFDQAVSDFQRSPDDLGLRRQVIKLSQELETPPKHSEEQKILVDKAIYLQKSAEGQADLLAAIAAYKKASFLAPWDGILYYNQGVIEQEAGLPGDAVSDFQLYLLAKPDADDHDKVLARIGELEALQDKKVIDDKRAVYHAVGYSVFGVGLCVLTGGILEWAIGTSGTPGGLYYTEAQGPHVYQGVDYNELYDGDYYSTSSYNQFIAAQKQAASLGETLTVVGAVVTVAGIVVLACGPSEPASVPDALLHYRSGQLAFGVPAVDFMPGARGLQTTLLKAQF